MTNNDEADRSERKSAANNIKSQFTRLSGKRAIHLQGRRNFMKTLSAMGVSTAALPYLSKNTLADLTDDPSDEVIRLSRLQRKESTPDRVPGDIPAHESAAIPDDAEDRPDREPVLYTIPRDEWAYRAAVRQATHDVREELVSDLEDEFDEDGLGKSQIQTCVTTINQGGTTERAVKVTRVSVTKKSLAKDDEEESVTGDVNTEEYEEDVDVEEETSEPEVSMEEIKEATPSEISVTVAEEDYRETVDGIPIVFEDQNRTEISYYDEEFRPLVGGCQMRQNRWTGGDATLATPAYYSEGIHGVLITSGHNVEGELGDSIYQPGGWGTSFGTAMEENYIYEQGENDAATIAVEDDSGAAYRLADEDGERYGTVEGVIGYDELEDELGESYELHYQGRTTGRDSGVLEDVSDEQDLGYVEVDGISPSGGDSGGPIYKDIYGNIYMVGHLNWLAGSGNLTTKVEDAFDVEVN